MKAAVTFIQPLQRLYRRLEALPAVVYAAVLLLALWPVWRWSAARLQDGSDEPLGLVALATLAGMVWWRRRAWSGELKTAWALATAMFVLVASLGFGLPMLVRAIGASLALSCFLAGIARPGQACLPFAGLLLLSLPLLSSLQFYAGYPLRVVTAEASLWLLRLLGFAAERSGAAMTVAGRLVLVDAPCSGIHMAWTAYFIACVAALLCALPDRQFLKRLPGIGLAVLVGNILRNTLLVTREAAGWVWPDWAHAAVGLVVLAGVCSAVFALMSLRAPAQQLPLAASRHSRGQPWLLALLLGCTAAPLYAQPGLMPAPRSAVAWPEQWEGRPLMPLALSPVEKRFAAQFPGAIGRFRDGDRLLVLRHIDAPTRMLHPAADCYRGLGYVISGEHLERDRSARLTRCFVAERNGRRIRVCERIADRDQHIFTDASSWYWAAAMGRSKGPWLAVTTAEAL